MKKSQIDLESGEPVEDDNSFFDFPYDDEGDFYSELVDLASDAYLSIKVIADLLETNEWAQQNKEKGQKYWDRTEQLMEMVNHFLDGLEQNVSFL